MCTAVVLQAGDLNVAANRLSVHWSVQVEMVALGFGVPYEQALGSNHWMQWQAVLQYQVQADGQWARVNRSC